MNNNLTAIEIIKRFLAEPYGCGFCDSGKLRSLVKQHSDNCPYFLAEQFLSRVNKGNEWIELSKSTPNVGETVEVEFLDGSTDMVRWKNNWNPEYEDLPKRWRAKRKKT